MKAQPKVKGVARTAGWVSDAKKDPALKGRRKILPQRQLRRTFSAQLFCDAFTYAATQSFGLSLWHRLSYDAPLVLRKSKPAA